MSLHLISRTPSATTGTLHNVSLQVPCWWSESVIPQPDRRAYIEGQFPAVQSADLPCLHYSIHFDGLQIANSSVVLQLQPQQALPSPMVHASRHMSSRYSGSSLLGRQHRLQRLLSSRTRNEVPEYYSRTKYLARALALIRYLQNTRNMSTLGNTGENRDVHEQHSAHLHLDGCLARQT